MKSLEVVNKQILLKRISLLCVKELKAMVWRDYEYAIYLYHKKEVYKKNLLKPVWCFR
jgi:hypothetical protein